MGKISGIIYLICQALKMKSFPNALTILVVFIFITGLLTYIIPKGRYKRAINPKTQQEVVVPGSYEVIQAEHLTFFNILTSIPRGMLKGGEVMILIFLVGGCLYLVEQTGALKDGIVSFTSAVQGKESVALWGVAGLFTIGGATEGLEEEIVPLIPVLLVFVRSLGYQPMVAVAVSYGSAVLGAAFSPINPFGAVIAQKTAEVPFLTNSLFRVGVFIVAFIVWMLLLIRYANQNRIEKDKTHQSYKQRLQQSHKVILSLLAFAFILLIVGMLRWNWGFNEISAEFFSFGIVIGIVGGFGLDGTLIRYAEGLKQMTFAALIGGIAYTIPLLLQEGYIMDTIINSLFTPLQYVPPMLSALGMMGSQALLHLILPSYSGQAVLTMPILAPLSDLIGISRDACILAYQYGAILMNMVSPTNGALMAIISMAGIQYDTWIKFIVKRLAIILAIGAVAILVALVMGI